ncbi:uncharacterized protein DUF4914 [Natranaerovirga hydrolytica]|uniref:Uncharacterized protein DUF4914 n=1 Tax=Natranaerovirga hydrolytica TaxID=680378 RepID=A0A4R1MYT7_9FIRM|nr:DUF4914 family protein [Natranaerovirga hydrolytica]TCK98478.1 uncharacterized protein DUF4914 [Natranaerovirga hydrolytica]
MNEFIQKMQLSDDILSIINNSKSIIVPKDRNHLLELALQGEKDGVKEVGYEVPNKGYVAEATVTNCKNGAVVNYLETYMRRRDPNCLLVADKKETDKERYEDRFGEKFDSVRQETIEWFKGQDLIIMPYMAGDDTLGFPGILVAPINAGFFAAGLADLQGFIPANEIPDNFKPTSAIYLAPPFRHTHYDGKQVVVHNRLEGMHEVFSFNLYPGPSAKKGIYGVLLNMGELEGWTTVHASTVRVTTPYDNTVTIMHEGASGGGKSEMLEEVHRQTDGRILYGTNTVTNEPIYLELKDTCELAPVTDDMGLCHPALQKDNTKLVVKDAEAGWFLRFDHIKEYGTSPHHEKLCTHPPEPLIFMNMQAAPGSTCLIWEHIMDAPGKPCPNPRVIMPRNFVPGVVKEEVEVNVRSFGVRVPPCTKEQPTYGIIGALHVLPPALAWLWRMVAPRGHGNPSIVDTEGMTSEGVGSYWPFATGKMVDQANLLLEQIVNTPDTKFVLVPNQHIGAYKVGFHPQWIAREFMARRGSAEFRDEQLNEARCGLLGYSLNKLKVDGIDIPKGLLQTNLQLEVGEEGYDKGAKILTDFFKKELEKFLTPDLNPLGRQIIECCMNDGSLEDYVKLIPMN